MHNIFKNLNLEIKKGSFTAILGHNGCGKSTLLNALIPDLNVKTAEISTTHDTGMHTTTFSEMFDLPKGGQIIDTPGIKGFGMVDMELDEISHYFPEIFRISKECRFGNCSHTHEPGCAVLEALNQHLIAQSRYQSYLSIREDITEGKYR